MISTLLFQQYNGLSITSGPIPSWLVALCKCTGKTVSDTVMFSVLASNFKFGEYVFPAMVILFMLTQVAI